MAMIIEVGTEKDAEGFFASDPYTAPEISFLVCRFSEVAPSCSRYAEVCLGDDHRVAI